MQNSCTRNAVPTAAIYVRTVTRQPSDANSLAAQERMCREHLDKVYGAGNYGTVVFADQGRSGLLGFRPCHSKSGEVRPGLSALADTIAQGKISIVICSDLSRLSRSENVLFRFLDHSVRRCGANGTDTRNSGLHMKEVICIVCK